MASNVWGRRGLPKELKKIFGQRMTLKMTLLEPTFGPKRFTMAPTTWSRRRLPKWYGRFLRFFSQQKIHFAESSWNRRGLGLFGKPKEPKFFGKPKELKIFGQPKRTNVRLHQYIAMWQ